MQSISKLDVGSAAAQEYLEEIKGYDGVLHYCNLCRTHVGSSKLSDHSLETRHKELSAILKDKETLEDKLVSFKSDSLSPSEDEFVAVKDIVLSCEKALKIVSDLIVQSDNPQPIEVSKDGSGENIPKDENDKMEEGKNDNQGMGDENVEPVIPHTPHRQIKGVMRAGLLANGLLMKDEINVRLVLLSVSKPTVELLSRIGHSLEEQLPTVTENKYDVAIKPENGCIIVSATKEPMATCKISLTSTSVRLHPFKYYNDIAAPDPDDMLPRYECEEALQALRRARWFESKVYALPYCEQVMKVFRDLCHRVPAWTRLTLWTLQQIVHKCLSSGDNGSLKAGTAVQRIFECIASGCLMPDSPGLYDPCEREPTDLCSHLTDQEREDITSSAQHALRLIAFQKTHTILDLPADVLTEKIPGKRKRSESQSDSTGIIEEKREKK